MTEQMIRVWSTDGSRFFNLPEYFYVDGFIDWENVSPESVPDWFILYDGGYDLDHIRDSFEQL